MKFAVAGFTCAAIAAVLRTDYVSAKVRTVTASVSEIRRRTRSTKNYLISGFTYYLLTDQI